jgi:phage gp46-like protein
MKDFLLEFGGGRADIGFEFADSLKNNVWLSIHIKRSELFWAPWFGSRLHEITKITTQSLLMAEAYVRDCLRWLIEMERIETIVSVTAQRDAYIYNRIVFVVSLKKKDEITLEYEIFYSVV